jgi:hypothetical protein
VPTAVVAVVAIPLVVLAAQREAPAPAPDPKEATLTVRLAGSDGSAGHPAFVRLTAVGAPPGDGTTNKLADDTGLLTADVSPSSDAASCADAELRTTGLEGLEKTAQWCLRIADADTGGELKGTISGAAAGTGPSTQLALTVTRRDAFLWKPFGVILAGLGVGLLVILVPQWSSRFVKRIVLSRLVEENSVADPDHRIEGLADFVNRRLKDGATEADTAALIAPVMQRGPAAAADARERLREAIAAAGSGAGPTFLSGANAEANRRTHSLSDFLDPSTGQSRPHPAGEWSSAVQRMVEATTFTKNAADRIGKLEAKCRKDPDEKLREARQTMSAIANPGAIGRLDTRLEELRISIENAESNPECRPATYGAPAATPPALALPEVFAPGPVITDPVRLRGLAWGAVILCAGLVLILVAFAMSTIVFSVYEPNQTFAGTKDYFLLFATALGSGAAASVLAITGWWRATAAAEAQ